MSIPLRRLELERAWNFRDLGGYQARDGRSIRWRRLFRADGLDRLTDADLRQIEMLGLRTVIDLRTADEVARSRLGPTAGDPAWHHLPLLDVLPPQEEYEAWARASYVAEQYLAMMDAASGSVAAFLTLVCNPDAYPVVFHCFAGKDRTGILTALVLGLLGVPDADIAEDYALSQAAMHHLLAWLRAEAGENAVELESRSAAIVAAEPAAMAAFLQGFPSEVRVVRCLRGRVGHPHAAALLAEVLLEP